MDSPITKHMRQLLFQYRNLRGKSCKNVESMWNVVVITTADETQRQAYEEQIQDKHSRKELPLDLPIHVVSDPSGPRIGNGGSTLVALEFLHSHYGESLYQQKILLIHAGGWSQRMPSATILGKVFAAIPHGEPIYQMLDLKLAMYCPLVPHMSPGVFLVCADDFLVYNLGKDDDWSIPSTGFTALAHPSSISIGRTHGVYVVDGIEKIDMKKTTLIADCLEVLQKPTDDRMKSRGALLQSQNGHIEFADGIEMEGEIVYSDSSFFFGVDVIKVLLKLKKEIGTICCEIDAYGDFLQALGPRATDGYIYNTSNISQMTPELTKMRKRVFDAVHDCNIHLLLMNASRFIHIGTTKELIHHFCQDGEFRSQMALQRDIFNFWLQGEESHSENTSGNHINNSGENHCSEESRGCVMHSVLMDSSSVDATSLVEYCHFDVPVVVEKNAIISNCRWHESKNTLSSSLVLPANTFFHTVSVLYQEKSYYVTIFFDISDNLKTSVAASSLTSLSFLGKTVGTALKLWHFSEGSLLPESTSPELKVSLWTLKLYRGAATMTESLDLALNMVHCLLNQQSLSQSLMHDDYPFFSLSDALALKDVSSMLNYRRKLFDKIRSGMA